MDEADALNLAISKLANGHSSLLGAPLDQSPQKSGQNKPTMMSREARSLINSEQGIQAWKVSPLLAVCKCSLTSVSGLEVENYDMMSGTGRLVMYHVNKTGSHGQNGLPSPTKGR